MKREKRKVVVVSLFDGLSGARVVFDRIKHLEVVRYYSSEVDKYAIQVANHNYPQDKPYRLGDITKVDGKSLIKEIREEFSDITVVLVGGSPCQGFSLAGKLRGSSTKCGKDVVTLKQYIVLKDEGFEFDGQSYLFWEFIRLQREINPEYFMLENVRVTKKWLPMFNNAIGVEPTRINSALVSAQNRDRYYWHNLGNIEQPKDKGFVLRDVLDEVFSPSVDVLGGAIRGRYEEDGSITQRLECNTVEKSNALTTTQKDTLIIVKPHKPIRVGMLNKGSQGDRIYSLEAKGIALLAQSGGTAGNGNMLVEVPCELREFSVNNGISYRKLLPLECERLQTLPDNYTLVIDKEGKQLVSNSQRYKMIGNGWTIDVPTHILGFIPLETD